MAIVNDMSGGPSFVIPKFDSASAVQGRIESKVGQISDLFSAVQAIINEIAALQPPRRGADEDDASWQQKLGEFQKKLDGLNKKMQDAQRRLSQAEAELAKLQNSDLPAAERKDVEAMHKAVKAVQDKLKKELEQMNQRLMAEIDIKPLESIPTAAGSGLNLDYQTEALVQAGINQGMTQDQAVVAAAEQISVHATNNPPYNPTESELQILFAAVEIETGIDATLMKAIAYGESLGAVYPDNMPRQFFDGELVPGIAHRLDQAENLVGFGLPVTFGDDREFGSDTCGFGLMAITANIDAVRAALQGENGGMVTVAGGGMPGSWYDGDTVEVDVARAMTDPYYNIIVAAELIQHKINIYSSPDRPDGPLSWVAANPSTAEEWALVGSTYQTYGGYGPGGGATERIFNRMTNPEYDAWSFTSGGVDLSSLPAGATGTGTNPYPNTAASEYSRPTGFSQAVWEILPESERAIIAGEAPATAVVQPDVALSPEAAALVAHLDENPQITVNQDLINDLMGPEKSWVQLESRCAEFGIGVQTLLDDRQADVRLLIPAGIPVEEPAATVPTEEPTIDVTDYPKPGGISESVWNALSDEDKAQIIGRMEGLIPPPPVGGADYSALIGLAKGANGSGDEGEPITVLHDFLLAQGYVGESFQANNGFHTMYGPLTEGAVQQFQVENGLEPTGEIDDATVAAMADPRPRPAGLAAPLWRAFGEVLGLPKGEYRVRADGSARQTFDNGYVEITADGQRFIRGYDGVDLVPPIAAIGIANSTDEASLHFLTQWGPTDFNDPPSGSDIPWGYNDCGPTSVAMCLSALGLLERPDKAGAYLTIDAIRDACFGYDTKEAYLTGPGTLGEGFEEYGAQMEVQDAVIDSVDDALMRGNPVIIGGRVWNAWASDEKADGNYLNSKDPGGHWVTVLGQTPEGNYIVGDPLVKGGPIEVTRAQLETFFEDSADAGWTDVLEISVADS